MLMTLNAIFLSKCAASWPNNRVQRRPRSESHIILLVLCAAPLTQGVRCLLALQAFECDDANILRLFSIEISLAHLEEDAMNLSMKPTKFRFLCLTLTCWVGFTILIGGRSSAHCSLRRVTDQSQESDISEKKHQYVVESVWNGCGFIPYVGWEGCMSQTGTALKCDDGARVYFVEEHCTSLRAATDEGLSRLEGDDRKERGWQIKRRIPLDDVLLIELAKPAQAFQEEPAMSWWICLWMGETSLKLIYGPDRGHIEEYFQAYYRGLGKR